MARQVVELPVDEVTLMEDRARVTRRARLSLAAGVHALTIEGVAPVVVDKTLRAEIEGGRVRDVRAIRRARHALEEREEAVRALEAQIEQTRDAVTRMERRLARAEAALGLVAAATERAVREMSEDAAWSRLDREAWEGRLEALAARDRELREERLGANRELSERRRELARLRSRRHAASRPSDALEAALWIDVEVDGEAGERTLTIEYVVPNACWRPHHRATLDGERLRFESEGCVWQNTGEDWTDAALRFSTQRPSLGAEPPGLMTDRLRVQRKSEQIHVEQRQQAVETSGLGRATEAAAELPGIDDAGEVLELAAPHRATVPSDGRPHRVALFAFDGDARVSLVCRPEVSAAVVLRTEHDHGGGHPVLAGPVDLVRGGGLVGRTSVLYVAPGERFELGWGPDPSLRVHRDVEELEPETNLLRNWHRVERVIVDKLSNLGPEAKRIELEERVPVSELEKVKIEVDEKKTTEGEAPDRDGFVRWTVVLPPFARERVELRYVLHRHADVVGL